MTLCFNVVMSLEALKCSIIYFLILSIPHPHPNLFWSNLIGNARADPAAKLVQSECFNDTHQWFSNCTVHQNDLKG